MKPLLIYPEKANDEPGWTALQKLVGVDDNGPHSKQLINIVGKKTDDATIPKDTNRKQKIINMIKKKTPDVMVFVEDDFMESPLEDNGGEKRSDTWETKGANNYKIDVNIDGQISSEIITINHKQNWIEADQFLYTCELDTEAARVSSNAPDEKSDIEQKYEELSLQTTNSLAGGSYNETPSPDIIEEARLLDPVKENLIRERMRSSGKGSYPSSIARHYKTFSNGVNQGGLRHDGTTIYWNAIKYVCIKISLFDISVNEKDGKIKVQGGVIVLLENRSNCKRFIVVGTHLSSDSKEKARKKEWKKVTDAVAHFKEVVADKESESDDYPVIYSMDANSHINYGEINHTKQTEEPSLHTTIFGEDSKMMNYWKNIKAAEKNRLYSVNKMRGLGSAQPLKVHEHEFQLIDWVFGTNIDFSDNTFTNYKDAATMASGEKGDGYVVGPLITDTEVVNPAAPEENPELVNSLMPNNLCPSDHLPIVLKHYYDWFE